MDAGTYISRGQTLHAIDDRCSGHRAKAISRERNLTLAVAALHGSDRRVPAAWVRSTQRSRVACKDDRRSACCLNGEPRVLAERCLRIYLMELLPLFVRDRSRCNWSDRHLLSHGARWPYLVSMSRDGPRDPPTANSFSNIWVCCQEELCLMSIICKSNNLLCDANLEGSIKLEKEITDRVCWVKRWYALSTSTVC